MTSEPAPSADRRLGAAVGRNVRRLRLARGMTAGDLTRAAGLSRATLTELEGGRGNPTVDTLAALARVLGAPVEELLSPAAGDTPVVVRAGAGPTVDRGTVRFRLLHRLALDRGVLETWHVDVAPGRHEAVPMPTGVLITAYAVAGGSTIGPQDDPVAVGPGDSVLYRADRPTLFAADDGPAVLLLSVAYPPVSAARALSGRIAADAPPPA